MLVWFFALQMSATLGVVKKSEFHQFSKEQETIENLDKTFVTGSLFFHILTRSHCVTLGNLHKLN